jgi:hypothetical protein
MTKSGRISTFLLQNDADFGEKRSETERGRERRMGRGGTRGRKFESSVSAFHNQLL